MTDGNEDSGNENNAITREDKSRAKVFSIALAGSPSACNSKTLAIKCIYHLRLAAMLTNHRSHEKEKDLSLLINNNNHQQFIRQKKINKD